MAAHASRRRASASRQRRDARRLPGGRCRPRARPRQTTLRRWCRLPGARLYQLMAARFGDVAAAQQQPGIPPVRVLDKPLAITPPAVRRIVRPVKKLRAPVVSTLAALAAGLRLCAARERADDRRRRNRTQRRRPGEGRECAADQPWLERRPQQNRAHRRRQLHQAGLCRRQQSGGRPRFDRHARSLRVRRRQHLPAGDGQSRARRVSLFDRQLGQARLRNTPVATIGVPGTELESLRTRPHRRNAQRRRRSCLHAQRRQMRELSSPGDTAVVTLGGVSRNPPGRGFSFAQFCSGDAGLCTPTAFAALSPLSPVTEVAALCGRGAKLSRVPPRRAQALQNRLRRYRRAIAETGARTSRS